VSRRQGVVKSIRESGIVAIIRIKNPEQVLPTVEALLAGGVSVIEVTMTVPSAIEQIARVSQQLGEGRGLVLGAGTVLDAPTAERAIGAGASFVVSPVFVPEVLDACRASDAAALPGCFSPSEIHTAFRSGADVIKLFPATSLGPGFLRDVRAPFPEIPIMPTGGVSHENVGAWFAAGAVAVGVGSLLVDAAAIARHDYADITARARTLVTAVRLARAVSEAF
jgi:2-dehydro-3-deoxyphosphogluconate aldolase/(4S)-4-hydroxy-2-oxoglutarate aldolase